MLDTTLVSKADSAFVALVISAVILAVFVFILTVFAVILAVFEAIVVGKPPIVAAVIPPTILTVVAKLPLPDPVTSPVKVVVAFASMTLVPITNPKFALASAAFTAPVPPLFNAIVVPLHTPELIVPTVVSVLEPSKGDAPIEL